MLITDKYRNLQSALHSSDPHYGSASRVYAPVVAKCINNMQVKEVLDYGAGKLGLMKAISDGRLVERPFKYIPYEPSNPKYAERPEPAEMVACVDVLEHIEPECLDAVLDDIRRVTQRLALITVCCAPAKRILADGRNAHLIVEGPEWWLPKLMQRMELHVFQKTPNHDGFYVLMAPYGG